MTFNRFDASCFITEDEYSEIRKILKNEKSEWKKKQNKAVYYGLNDRGIEIHIQLRLARAEHCML